MHKYTVFWAFLLVSIMTSSYGAGDEEICHHPEKRIKVSDALRGESDVTGGFAEQDQEKSPLKRTAEEFLGSPGKRHEALKEGPQDASFSQPTGSTTTMLTFSGPSLEALDDYVLWEIVKPLPFSEIAKVRTLSKSFRDKIDGLFVYINQQRHYVPHDVWRGEWKGPMVVFRFQDLYRVGNLCSEAMYLSGDAQAARELDKIILMLPKGLNLRKNIKQLREETSSYVDLSTNQDKETVVIDQIEGGSEVRPVHNTESWLLEGGVKEDLSLRAPTDEFLNQSGLTLFSEPQEGSLTQIAGTAEGYFPFDAMSAYALWG